jgi:hypothetical protein
MSFNEVDMALFKTDWSHELDQVNASFSMLLDEKVEPMIEKTLDRGVEEIEKALDKASAEMHIAIQQMSVEVDKQRRLLVRDIGVIIGASLIAITLVGFALVSYYKA